MKGQREFKYRSLKTNKHRFPVWFGTRNAIETPEIGFYEYADLKKKKN